MGRCDRGRSFNLLQMTEEGVKCERRGDFDTAKEETQIQHRRRDMWEKKWGRGNFNTAEGGLCFVRKLSPNQVREKWELRPNCWGPATSQHSFAVNLTQMNSWNQTWVHDLDWFWMIPARSNPTKKRFQKQVSAIWNGKLLNSDDFRS